MSNNKYGKIISYRPNIKYRRKDNDFSTSINSYETYTVTEDFVSNTPSNNLIKINNIIVKAKEILKDLELLYFDIKYSDCSFIQYCNYIKDGKESSVKEIYDKAINDIDSNIVFETYKQVYDEYTSLINFDNIYSTINYGKKNISIDEAIKVDEEKIEEISSLERNDLKKINYASMYFESKLNKIVESKLEVSSLFIDSVGTVPTVSYNSQVTDKTDLDVGINLLFKNINEEYKDAYNLFSNSNSTKDFEKMYKYISKQLMDYYELLSINKSITNNISDEITSDIDKTINSYKDKINDNITQLYVNVMNSTFDFDKYLDKLIKKSDTKSFYQS